MTENMKQAKQLCDDLCKDLSDAVREVTSSYTANLDQIVKDLSKGINLYSNSELWDFQVRLSIEAYILGNVKEQGSLKEACAEALEKESMAQAFVTSEGTQEVKRQQSILKTTDMQAVSMLYASVASLLKTKCDEAHRLVNVLQGIQISRAAEAKQMASPRSEADQSKLLLENI